MEKTSGNVTNDWSETNTIVYNGSLCFYIMCVSYLEISEISDIWNQVYAWVLHKKTVYLLLVKITALAKEITLLVHS